jgi:hypothetical protein
MKLSRALAIATSIVVALPAISTAQQGRDFKNAWFWGVKGGGLTLADSGQMYRQSPMAGIDWLITRSRGGLYISGSQSFFKQQTFTLRDPSAPVDSGPRVIDLQNLRRLDVAVMGFPGEHVRFHPYIGAGFTLSQIATAVPQGPFANVDQLSYADQVIQDQKIGFSPLFILGGQYRLRRVSVFLQGTATPTQKNFLLYNGRSMNFSYEAGLRYNVGSSIDRN